MLSQINNQIKIDHNIIFLCVDLFFLNYFFFFFPPTLRKRLKIKMNLFGIRTDPLFKTI